MKIFKSVSPKGRWLILTAGSSQCPRRQGPAARTETAHDCRLSVLRSLDASSYFVEKRQPLLERESTGSSSDTSQFVPSTSNIVTCMTMLSQDRLPSLTCSSDASTGIEEPPTPSSNFHSRMNPCLGVRLLPNGKWSAEAVLCQPELPERIRREGHGGVTLVFHALTAEDLVI
eukprot:Gregarina_sp_Poly_1__6726@NODE_361_length_9223_cov_159_738751_g298_i0_p4_GENE_NODE_361_length_9223_cov_159_738751_g298_i0NODE_361_length_9223_cov_159_738751_g298_i0_p4_ORF_typecomplete_len173_score19_21_NODE_361_length_9223_cov_159_738751_g298_i083818899